MMSLNIYTNRSFRRPRDINLANITRRTGSQRQLLLNPCRHPLNQRVLDASCGSGTFLFHAIRSYLAAAEAQGRQPS